MARDRFSIDGNALAVLASQLDLLLIDDRYVISTAEYPITGLRDQTFHARSPRGSESSSG